VKGTPGSPGGSTAPAELYAKAGFLFPGIWSGKSKVEYGLAPVFRFFSLGASILLYSKQLLQKNDVRRLATPSHILIIKWHFGLNNNWKERRLSYPVRNAVLSARNQPFEAQRDKKSLF